MGAAVRLKRLSALAQRYNDILFAGLFKNELSIQVSGGTQQLVDVSDVNKVSGYRRLRFT